MIITITTLDQVLKIPFISGLIATIEVNLDVIFETGLVFLEKTI